MLIVPRKKKKEEARELSGVDSAREEEKGRRAGSIKC
ncbi:hypothetical protein J2Y67_004516 [Neobacillus niacini]|nr:hypothetical protein [Neobacillus niacini]